MGCIISHIECPCTKKRESEEYNIFTEDSNYETTNTTPISSTNAYVLAYLHTYHSPC